MAREGYEVVLTDLEMDILRAFFNHVYLTDTEMAAVLKKLAHKLERGYIESEKS